MSPQPPWRWPASPTPSTSSSPEPMTAGAASCYSADKGELAVIANGLTEPAGDREYRCWVEIDGQRTPVGKMFFGGDLAFWAGPVETISDLPPGSTFGVSLVDTAGSDVGEPPVLTGDVAE